MIRWILLIIFSGALWRLGHWICDLIIRRYSLNPKPDC